MPSRDKELGPLIRGVFLPEEGEPWAKPDISQQEFRFVVHYAVQHYLPGAQEAAELYRNDPDADFHTLVAEMTGLDRSMAKAFNFAKIYGAGVRKFAEMIGKPLARSAGHRRPVRPQAAVRLDALRHLSGQAERVGYTELYDGARRHWNQYEASGFYAKGAGPCGLEEARRRSEDPAHPWYCQRLSRANVYTALNALI